MAGRSVLAKNNRLLSDIALIDGVAGLNGRINAYSEGGRAAGTLLYTVPLDKPCATVSDGAMTFAGFPKEAITALGGVVAELEFADGNNVMVIDGVTVGLATEVPVPNAIVDVMDVRQDQKVRIASAKITHG